MGLCASSQQPKPTPPAGHAGPVLALAFHGVKPVPGSINGRCFPAIIGPVAGG